MTGRGGVAAALAVVYVVWGSTYVAMKVSVRELPPLAMCATRFLVAGLLVYGWCVWQRRRHPDRGWRAPTVAQWRVGAILGVLLPAAGTGGASWAALRLPAGTVALVLATIPVWMTIADRVTGGARITVRVGAGLVAGVIGVAVLADPLAAHAPDPLATAVALAGAMTWGVGSVYAQRAPHPDQPLIASGIQMISGGLALSVVSLVLGEWSDVHLHAVLSLSGVSLAYQVVAGSLLAYSAYAWLLDHVSSRVAGTYAFVNPVVALLLAWWLLAEQIGDRTAVAAVVIVFGVILLVTAPRAAFADKTDGVGGIVSPDKEVDHAAGRVE